MTIPRFLLSGRWLMAMLIAQVGLAQPAPTTLKLQDHAVVTDDGTWVYLPLGEDPAVVQAPDKDRRWVKSIAEGTSFGFRTARDGYIWDIRRITTVIEGKPERRGWLFRLPLGQATAPWERVGELDTTSGVPAYLVPLDREGWFLGMNPFMGFFKEGRASHVALFRLNNERILFEDLVDMPFRKRTHVEELESMDWPRPAGLNAKATSENQRKMQKAVVSPSSLTPDLWLPALLPHHLVLGATKAGVLWFFNLKDGQCQKTMDFGNVDTDELDKMGHLDHFLLAAQPDKEHRLLVVTRQPEVILFARAHFTPPGAPKDVWKGNHERFMEIMEEHRGLQWWTIDPATWSKERIEDPVSFPEHAISFAQAGKLRFLVGPEGRVHANTTGSWQDLYGQMGILLKATPPKNKVEKESEEPNGKAKDPKPTPKANLEVPGKEKSGKIEITRKLGSNAMVTGEK